MGRELKHAELRLDQASSGQGSLLVYGADRMTWRIDMGMGIGRLSPRLSDPIPKPNLLSRGWTDLPRTFPGSRQLAKADSSNRGQSAGAASAALGGVRHRPARRSEPTFPASGQPAAAPPSSVMNSRRFIRSPRRRGRAALAARRGRAPWRI